MNAPLWFWIAFHVGVFAVLAVDLFGFNRRAHAPSTKESLLWTLVWLSLSLGFNAWVWSQLGRARHWSF